MAEDDFRAKIGREDFQAHLREMPSEEIKFQLKTNRIAHPDKRALAEIELEERAAESEPLYRDEQVQSFREFHEILLIAFARADDKKPGEILDLKDIAEDAGLQFRPGWVRKAAMYFRDHGFLQDAFSMSPELDGGMEGYITAQGLEQAETLLSARGEPEVQQRDAGVPASDRHVQLDHNSPEYAKATETMSDVIEVVRANNEYAASEPEDHEQRLSELEAGAKLLGAVRVSVAGIAAVLLPALGYLAAKFADAAIGNAAGAALEAVRTLFGI